jgi:hypothetical protein
MSRARASLVQTEMATRTQRNQVLFRIASTVASELFVMNLKVGHRAASLTPPAVPAQYLLAKFFVSLAFESQGRTFWQDGVHETFAAK